jgi:hypothetical protein
VFLNRDNFYAAVRLLQSCVDVSHPAFLQLVVTFFAGIRIKLYKHIYKALHFGVLGYLSSDDSERENDRRSASEIYLKGEERGQY